MKIIFFCFFITSTIFVSAQADSLNVCSNKTIEKAQNVIAYIHKKKGKKFVKWKYFYKGITIELSDNSYKIERFCMTWTVSRNDNVKIIQNCNNNNHILNDANTQLSSIAPGVLIAFDNIIASKDGICYKIASFAVNTVLKKEK